MACNHMRQTATDPLVGGDGHARILRIGEVQRRTGLSRTTLWRRERNGRFPARRDLGGGMVGWLEREVEEWIEGRPSLGVSAHC
jgi:prophage regulatory protein